MQFDNNGWLDAAQEVDYLNKSESREGNTIKYLILHGTAGGASAQGIANYFATGTEQASAHIIIDQQGTIVQGCPLSLAAWANGPIDGTPADNLGFRTESDGVHCDSWWDPNLNPNYITVSIEHCKASIDNSDQLTSVQQAASFAVVSAICDTYGIPKRFADSAGGITGHFSMSAINRQHCPGPYPWQELFDYLNGGDTPMIPANWTDDGTTLTAPNKIPVTLGFRDHVLNSSWDSNNWPLEPAQHLDLVEQSNPSLGSGQVQTFRWKRLEYTSAAGVFEGWLGQELLWNERQVDQLQALPAVSNVLAVNKLAAQIVQKTQVQ